MKKFLIPAVIFAACLMPGATRSLGAKKSDKPVQERYVGKVVPYTGNNSKQKSAPDDNSKLQIKLFEPVDVAIKEFTGDQEIHELAQTYRDAGNKGLQKALSKNNNGFFRIQSMPVTTILYATSTKLTQDPAGAKGPTRLLAVLGDSPLGQGQAPNVYTYIQLRVDDQGNGTGLLLLIAVVKFDEQGRLVVSPFPNQSFDLGEVHLTK
jgi:hypothetical protein